MYLLRREKLKIGQMGFFLINQILNISKNLRKNLLIIEIKNKEF